jgi:O-antigen/teichoic acid export membrane protein
MPNCWRAVISAEQASRPLDDAAFIRRGIRALGWQSGATITTQFVQAVVSMAVVAVVTPAEFGVYGLAAVLLNGRTLFQLGIGQALILFRGSRPDFRRAVDTSALATGLLAVSVAALLVLAAGRAASMFPKFDQSDLTLAFQFMAVALALGTLEDVPSSLLERDMQFKRRAAVEGSTSIAYAIGAITLLIVGLGIWSVLIARTVQSLLRWLGFWSVAPIRPRIRSPQFSRPILGSLIRVGLPLSLAGIVAFATANLDTVAVGFVGGGEAVGAYVLAFTVAGFAPTLLGDTVVRVSFPMYAESLGALDRIRAVFAAALHLVSVLMLPLTALLLLVVPGLLVAAFGDEWAAAEAPLRVLSLYALARTVADVSVSLAAATGRPTLPLRARTAGLLVSIAGLPLLAGFGAAGVAGAFAIGQVAVAAVALHALSWLNLAGVVRLTLAAMAASAVATLTAYVVFSAAGGDSGLVVAAVALIAVYLPMLWLLDSRTRSMLRRLWSATRAQPVESG